MRTSLDTYLGIHPQALQLEAKRNELLAANLANVDTPNYKARDIDFKAALAAAGGAGSAGSGPLALRAATGGAPAGADQAGGSTAAIGTAGDPAAGLDPSTLKYRTPMAPALDGNTVDEQLEQSAYAENNVRYQASLTFLGSALKDLMTAIVGS